MQADVSDLTALEDLFQQALKEFGKIDIVVADAGVEIVDQAIADVTEGQFDQVLAQEVGNRGITVNSIIPTAIEGAGVFTDVPQDSRCANWPRACARSGTVRTGRGRSGRSRVLRRPPRPGSANATQDRLERLRAAGLNEAELSRLRAPIDLQLGGGTPQETAVAIAAEIIAVAHDGTGPR
ncbi:SDR family oxidoreductase [Streptomyces sp. VRA16 Mangrove soil]|uniref:SDR family oxidoreductase n=1 Tax=Streptomyces sp. VRA16 Mangrove soil TaxID=2817434 RepID=UPI0035ABEA18